MAAFGENVAKIGSTEYETLEAAWNAVQNGETITLLSDCNGNGLKAPQAKFTTGLTVDFGGYTYTMDGTMVGSTGTETQAFQLLKDNNITFKNGTIYSEKAKILVQNYSNLTLEGMTLTLNNPSYSYAYTLSNNNGNIVIDGTTINANPNGAFAFDVCRFSSYPSVNVEVKGDSYINGNIEISASSNDAKDGFGLTLTSGTLTGNIVYDSSALTAMENSPEKTSVTVSNDFVGANIAAPNNYTYINGEMTPVVNISPDNAAYTGQPYAGAIQVTSVAGTTVSASDGYYVDFSEDQLIEAGEHVGKVMKGDDATSAVQVGLVTFTINKFEVLVNTNYVWKYYGQLDPNPTYTLVDKQGNPYEGADVGLTNIKIVRADVREAIGDYPYQLNWSSLEYDEDHFTLLPGKSDVLAILPIDLDYSQITVTLDPTSYKYTGDAIEPEPVVKYNSPLLGEITLQKDVDYTLSWADNTNVGTASVTVKAIESATAFYKGNVTKQFTIVGAEQVFDIAAVPVIYNGKDRKQDAVITVKHDGEEVDPANYTITWDDREVINADSYEFTVFVTGGNYTTPESGQIAYFEIKPKSIKDETVTLGAIAKQYWNNKPKSPAITLTDSEVGDATAAYTLEENVDFTAVYSDNTAPGTGKVTITGIGNYKDEIDDAEFTIMRRGLVGAGDKIEVTVNDESYPYNGSEQKPTVTIVDKGVKDGDGNYYELTEDDYELVFDEDGDYTNVGNKEFKIVAKATGNYRQELTATYQIVAANIWVKADDITIAFGTTAPDNTYTVYSDEELTAKLTGDFGQATYTYKDVNADESVEASADQPTDVGEYNIYLTLAQNTNYIAHPVAGTLTITEAQIIAKVKDQKITYGDELEDFSLEYVNGLIVANPDELFTQLTAEADDLVVYNVYNKEDQLLETLPTDCGEYKVKAEQGFKVGNYIVSIQPGTLTINAKDITDDPYATIDIIGDFVYDGTPKTAEFTFKYGDDEFDANDYEVKYENNVNAGTATVTVTLKDGGNYEGSKTGTFGIAERALTVVVADATAPYNLVREFNYNTTFNDGADDTRIESVQNAVEAEEAALLEALNAAATVKFEGIPTSAGKYSEKLYATFDESKYTSDQVALLANYAMEEVTNGTLFVEKAQLTLTLKDVETIYGEDPEFDEPAYEVDEENSDITETELTDLDLLLKDVVIGIDEGTDLNVGEHPDAIVGSATSSNYEVVFTPAKLTITARPVKIIIDNQEIDFGGELDQDAWYVAEVDDDNMGVVEGDDLQIELTTEETAVGEYEGVITATSSNTNYDVTFDAAGNLKIKGASLLALERGRKDDAVVNLLKGYNGQTVEEIHIIGTGWTNIDYWYTLSLPFETSIRELSKAFGYAVVDVPDDTNTDEGVVAFEVLVTPKTIPANTLILVKTDEARDLNGEDDTKEGPLVFKNKTIVYNPEYDAEGAEEDETPFIKTDAAGNQFIPTYTQTWFNTDDDWYLYGGKFYNAGALASPGNYTAALQGYFKAKSGAGARIFVQEADGTVNAINAVNVDRVMGADGWYNVNGMKLNDQPTQKGVYINNGKKVVVK